MFMGGTTKTKTTLYVGRRRATVSSAGGKETYITWLYDDNQPAHVDDICSACGEKRKTLAVREPAANVTLYIQLTCWASIVRVFSAHISLLRRMAAAAGEKQTANRKSGADGNNQPSHDVVVCVAVTLFLVAASIHA